MKANVPRPVTAGHPRSQDRHRTPPEFLRRVKGLPPSWRDVIYDCWPDNALCASASASTFEMFRCSCRVSAAVQTKASADNRFCALCTLGLPSCKCPQPAVGPCLPGSTSRQKVRNTSRCTQYLSCQLSTATTGAQAAFEQIGLRRSNYVPMLQANKCTAGCGNPLGLGQLLSLQPLESCHD